MGQQPPLSDDDSQEDQVPGYRNYIIYTDESGMDRATYYGFGTLWIPWERRGDLAGELAALRRKHRLDDELKWSKISARSAPFAADVVRWFFKHPWLMFHCVLVPKAEVDWSLHKGRDVAQRKHFSMLLKNKIAYFARAGGRVYRLRVDPLPWRYPKSGEIVHKVVNAQLKQELGEAAIHDVITCESKRTAGIQVADLLLGAVLAAWQDRVEAVPKLGLMRLVAEHLGWDNLRHDTARKEWKFNIWHFHDPQSEAPRRAATKEVRLKNPLPPFRPALRPPKPTPSARR